MPNITVSSVINGLMQTTSNSGAQTAIGVAASGKTFLCSNNITLQGADGATINVGIGGTLGSAAFTSSGAYAPLNGALGTPTSGNASNLTNLNASNLSSGTVPTAQLGSFLGTIVTNGGIAGSQVVSGLVANTRGGTGMDSSASTGIAQVSTGTWSFSNSLPSAATVDGTNLVGFRGAPQNSQSTAYTTVLADAGKSIFHPVGDNNARTFTIDSNANVAFPIGTIIEFINMAAASATISITSDTLTLLPAGTTGSRTLAQYGRASAEKITSTSWVISGNSALT